MLEPPVLENNGLLIRAENMNGRINSLHSFRSSTKVKGNRKRCRTTLDNPSSWLGARGRRNFDSRHIRLSSISFLVLLYSHCAQQFLQDKTLIARRLFCVSRCRNIESISSIILPEIVNTLFCCESTYGQLTSMVNEVHTTGEEIQITLDTKHSILDLRSSRLETSIIPNQQNSKTSQHCFILGGIIFGLFGFIRIFGSVLRGG